MLEVLSRNWWWKLLNGNELEIERGGFFFKPFDALLSELLFVMFDAFFDVFVSIAQHAINEPSEMMGQTFGCDCQPGKDDLPVDD
jgi:hypothetical protein